MEPGSQHCLCGRLPGVDDAGAEIGRDQRGGDSGEPGHDAHRRKSKRRAAALDRVPRFHVSDLVSDHAHQFVL
jgi:hypothetical protein